MENRAAAAALFFRDFFLKRGNLFELRFVKPSEVVPQGRFRIS